MPVDNERLQEFFLMIGDKIAPINKRWWYVLGVVVIGLIPAFYLTKFMFTQIMIKQYVVPQVTYSIAVKEPLQILDKKIFSLSNNSYSGYVKIKNINLEWGVENQDYTVEFKTLGGTLITKISGQVFILPASEKIIVFARFTSQQKPDQIVVTLGDTRFIHKPDVSANFEQERINIQNTQDGTVVTAGIKSLSALTISEVSLPLVLYDNKSNVVGVGFTTINNLVSGETRTFQYSWPTQIAGVMRAEINPEINIFDRNLFSTEGGISPFSNP